ncbi:MAG TPA: NAD(P)H-quinone oxidoreductase [Streptosporangiaceae bacterium]|nr:NAD(P)H-quinone oxidoreductase [Streptosporangiaceae bacterium]
MRAVVITRPGDPDVLCMEDVPDPVPGPGEVLIDITAAGLNRADVMQRQGMYPPPRGAPPYPGLECSGRVGQVGPGVTRWQVGDEVCALLAGGGYAEKVAVPEGQVMPLPEGVTLTDAAALPEAACTLEATVYMKAGLAPGETYLLHGGAGGIGTLGIQIAKAEGVVVACTAGTAEKVARCRDLGADLAICYREQDFVEAMRAFTADRGADVILDVVGAPYLERNVATLAIGGRLVLISMQGGTRGEVDLAGLMLKRTSIYASTLRARPVGEKSAVVASARDHVWPLVAAGKVRPVIDRVFPMAEAAQAHRLMDEGSHIGKILLVN